MFLNYLAGVVSLVLAVSAFVPWVTVWFYSLKGIESVYGIGILLAGLLGVTVSAFQHLSGRIRGRAYIIFALVSLGCEALYLKKMARIGETINSIFGYLKDTFGEQVMLKLQEIMGERVLKIAVNSIKWVGVDTSVSGLDFVGGGLILAVISSLTLLAVGGILEKNKTTVE